MAEETSNSNLSERLSDLGGDVQKREAGSNFKFALGGAVTAALLGGGAYLGMMLSDNSGAPAPTRETSRITGFAEDNAGMAAPAQPARQEPIVQRELIQDPEQQKALEDLQAKLAALNDQLDAQAGENDRAAKDALEELRDAMAANMEALEKKLENDLDAANAEKTKLSNDLQAAQAKAEADRQAWQAQQRALENQLRVAQNTTQRAEPTAEELEQQRLEDERREQLRLAAEQQQARVSSGLLAFKGAGASSSDAATRDLSARESFVASAAKQVAVSVSTKIALPEITVVQGTIIQAALETAIDSSLPGTLRAVVAEDVHSFDGRNILIPQGSKLFGEYQSDLTIADSRILVAWNRVVTPEGRTAVISSYGGDDLGRSGTTGQVHRHFLQRFGTAAMISIIGAAPTLAASRVDNTAAQDALENVGNDLSRQTASVIGEHLSIPPTIRVDQGARIAVILDRDLVMP